MPTLTQIGVMIAAVFFLITAVIADAGNSSSSVTPWMKLLQKLVTQRPRPPLSEKYTWVPMNVTGPVVVGGSNVTLYGDAKSINAQVLKMNPNYNAEDFVEHAVTPPGQPKTAVVPPFCNIWPEGGSINLLEEGIVALNSSVFPVVAPAHTCVALTCIDGASIGLCNDNYEPITQIPRNLVVYLEILVNYCLSSTGTVNGQVFDVGKFNVVFDSGHCTAASLGANWQGMANTTYIGAPTVGGLGPVSNGYDKSADTSGGDAAKAPSKAVSMDNCGDDLTFGCASSHRNGTGNSSDTSGSATDGNHPDPHDPGHKPDPHDPGNKPDPNDPGRGGDTSMATATKATSTTKTTAEASTTANCGQILTPECASVDPNGPQPTLLD